MTKEKYYDIILLSIAYHLFRLLHLSSILPIVLPISIIFLSIVLYSPIVGNILAFELEISESTSAFAVNSLNSTDSRYVNFRDPTNLSNNPRDSVYSQIAAYKNNVYIVWEEEATENTTPTTRGDVIRHDNRNYDIYFKKSTDGGGTFSKAINISNNSGFSEHPQIAISGRIVYIAWTDDASFNKEILFKKSSDEGNNFGKTIKLSNDGGESYNQEISAFANNVYVVWENKFSANNTNDIKGISSTDGTSIDNNNKINSVSQELERLNNNHNNRILFKSSTDRGNSFTNTRVITTNSEQTAESYPKIAASNDSYVYIVWTIGMPPIGSDNASSGYNKYTGNNKNTAEQNQGVFFTKSFDNGVNFMEIVKLNKDVNYVGESQIASSGNEVYITWSGNSDNLIPNDLFFIKSTDNGNTFTEESSLRKNSSLNAELAVTGNDVYIIWQDLLKPNNQEILIKKSLDRGNTFVNIITNISNNKGTSECPSIAISKNFVYAVWEDDTPGNHEIFFAKSNNNNALR
jgi:hypothetical protein